MVSGMASNMAAWAAQPRTALSVGPAPMPDCGPDQIIVRNHAIALNPIDWKMRDFGMLVKQWPIVLGCDIAGDVVQTGRNITRVKPGDRAVGQAMVLASGNNAQGAYQLYTVVPGNMFTPIPDHLTYEQAAVIPLSISCAASGLFGASQMAKSGSVLIWGASSSVGSSAVQLAVHAGLRVIATASRKNHDQVKKLGAAQVFDYNEDIEELLVEALGTDSIGVFDVIGTNFDICARIVGRTGGCVATTLNIPENRPANIAVKQVYALSIQKNEIGAAIYETFLPSALADGTFVAYPQPTIVGTQLEDIQEGLQRLKSGVSSQKLVISLT